MFVKKENAKQNPKYEDFKTAMLYVTRKLLKCTTGTNTTTSFHDLKTLGFCI